KSARSKGPMIGNISVSELPQPGAPFWWMNSWSLTTKLTSSPFWIPTVAELFLSCIIAFFLLVPWPMTRNTPWVRSPDRTVQYAPRFLSCRAYWTRGQSPRSFELHGLYRTDLRNDQGRQHQHQKAEQHHPDIEQYNGGQVDGHGNVLNIVFLRIGELEQAEAILQQQYSQADEIAPEEPDADEVGR